MVPPGGSNPTSAAGGKAALQTPPAGGVSTYRENQTKNHALGRAMSAHAWVAGGPAATATAEAARCQRAAGVARSGVGGRMGVRDRGCGLVASS
jgi:hypothetical protein